MPRHLAMATSKQKSKKSATRKPAAKKPAPRQSAPKAKPRPRVLSGGNPQIPKADGDRPVQAYIAAMPGWKRAIGERLDASITAAVPGITKAVKWNSPFYGVRGRGWCVAFHVFTHYVKVTFFAGSSLQPAPPGGKGAARWLDIRDDGFDEAQFVAWVEQASRIPGWGKN